MSAPLSKASHSKIGTCPHGLPQGACPICSGMGGGGGVKKDNKPREMTYNECLAVWQMMKAQKAARKQTLALFAAQDQAAYLNKLQAQINQMKLTLLNSILPKPAAKIVIALADTVILPVLKAVHVISNTIGNALTTISKLTGDVKQKVVEIMDKLTAMFGEAKASLQKKIEEKFKDIKKKVFSLFGIAAAENEEDDEAKRIEEAKRLYELNTAKEALFNVMNNEKEDLTDESDKK